MLIFTLYNKAELLIFVYAFPKCIVHHWIRTKIHFS